MGPVAFMLPCLESGFDGESIREPGSVLGCCTSMISITEPTDARVRLENFATKSGV